VSQRCHRGVSQLDSVVVSLCGVLVCNRPVESSIAHHFRKCCSSATHHFVRYYHVSSIQPLTFLRECMGMHGQPGSVTGATVMHRMSWIINSSSLLKTAHHFRKCCSSYYYIFYLPLQSFRIPYVWHLSICTGNHVLVQFIWNWVLPSALNLKFGVTFSTSELFCSKDPKTIKVIIYQ